MSGKTDYMKEESYEFQWIEKDNLKIIEENPNELSEQMAKHLGTTIKERGFMDVLTVIQDEEAGKFLIVNGAHRLREDVEERKKLPCFIIKGKTEHDALVDMVNLNRIHGEFNPKKYGDLLKKLETMYSKENVQKLLNYSEAELDKIHSIREVEKKAHEKLKGMQEPKEKITEAVVEMEITQERTIRCPHCSKGIIIKPKK